MKQVQDLRKAKLGLPKGQEDFKNLQKCVLSPQTTRKTSIIQFSVKLTQSNILIWPHINVKFAIINRAIVNSTVKNECAG